MSEKKLWKYVKQIDEKFDNRMINLTITNKTILTNKNKTNEFTLCKIREDVKLIVMIRK